MLFLVVITIFALWVWSLVRIANWALKNKGEK